MSDKHFKYAAVSVMAGLLATMALFIVNVLGRVFYHWNVFDEPGRTVTEVGLGAMFLGLFIGLVIFIDGVVRKP